MPAAPHARRASVERRNTNPTDNTIMAYPTTRATTLGHMAHRPDPECAVETFNTGNKKCRLCKCRLRMTNPEPYCAPCDTEYGPFPTVLTPQRESARQSGRTSPDAKRKREARRRKEATT